MKIEKIELSLTDRLVSMDPADGYWQYGDVTVSTDENGALSVSAQHTPICMVRIVFEKASIDNPLVLGDAWERGYADLEWKKPEASNKMPWYFFAYDGTGVLCFGVKTQPNALCFWQYDGKQPVLTLDLRSGTNPVRLAGRTLSACTVVTAQMEGDLHSVCAAFCRQMCDNPRTIDRPVYGGNDWYCNYGDNSYEKIRVHAQWVVECADVPQCPKYRLQRRSLGLQTHQARFLLCGYLRQVGVPNGR